MHIYTSTRTKPTRRNIRRASSWLIATSMLLFMHVGHAQSEPSWKTYYAGVIPHRLVGSVSSFPAAVQSALADMNATTCDVSSGVVPGSAFLYNGPSEATFGGTEWYSSAQIFCVNTAGAPQHGGGYDFKASVCPADGSAPPCGQQYASETPPGDCAPPPSDVKIDNTTNPCDPASGNKSQVEVDYSSNATGGLSFTRYYNSNGPYKTGHGMPAGWRHTYSRTINEVPDRRATLTFGSAGGQSSNYSNASDACTSGFGILKDSVWSGDLATATATFVGGNTCKVSSGGSTVAYFPVRAQAGWPNFSQAANIKTVTRSHGAIHTFEFDGSNWINHLNPVVTLVPSGNNWVFTDGNDTQETYNASGQLITITYRNGRSETLDYDLTTAQGGDNDSSTLDKVTGPFGHTLTFDHNANGQLVAVNTPDGAVQYARDGSDNLATVTYPDLTTRQYLFEKAIFPNHLTGIIDENSDRYATWAYDYHGRATLSEHAGGKEQVDLKYNSDGTTTLTMANGAERIYTYSTQQGHRRLAALSGDVCGTCTQGNIKNRTYDSDGYIAEVTDWNGNITKTDRNARGLVETLTEALGTAEQRVTTKIWHANYRLPTQVTSPKNVTDYTYDTNGNVLSITVSGGGKTRSWGFTYNANGQPLTIDGPRTTIADVTTLEYYACAAGNECGQLKKVTNALGHVTTYNSYDNAGRLTQLTGPNGLQTALTYDSRGQVLTATQTPPTGTPRVVTMTYDDAGQVATQTMPDGSMLTYAYDAAHSLTSVTDTVGNSIAYDYDAMGNQTDEDVYDPADTLKRTLDFAYDINDRIDTVADGGFGPDLTFDLVGNLTAAADPNSNLTQHSYDALNRLDTTIDALSSVIDYNYDDHDNLTQVVAANNATTSYVYDSLDNLLSETSPDRGLISYTHDDAGNRLTATDARGITSTYSYDALNRLTSISYPDSAENVVYGYDDVAANGIGRLTSMNDQSGTTTYTYDAFGSVASDVRQVAGVTYTVSYQYDAAGRVSSMTYPSGRTVDYVRDAVGQVTQVTSTKNSSVKNVVTSASYEPFGPIKDLTYGNGLNFDYQHRTDYRTSSISSTSIADKLYGFDAAGNITTIDDALNADLRRDYSFDDLNRLSSESIPSSYSDLILADNPFIYWRLAEASGSVAIEASGNGPDGTYGSNVLRGQPGLVSGPDTAIRIDPPTGNSYVFSPTLTGTSVTGVELWFRTDSVANYRDLLSLRSYGHVRTLIYHDKNGKIGIWRLGAAVLMSDNSVSSSEAHHIALWYEPGSNTTFLMVDGVTQANSYSGNLLAVTDAQVMVGAYSWNGRVYSRMLGEIDEVVVYNTPVTAGTFADRTLPIGSGAPVSNAFAYDANGNRTSLDDAGVVTTFGYPAFSNQLTSIDSVAIQRDDAGNRIADVGGTRTYSYDDTNRLSEVLDNGISTASYVHNALGQRTSKTVGTANTVYVYDLGGNLIAEHDATGTLIRDYVWLNGIPVAQVDQGEAFSYLHFDHLGTPRLATNDAQIIVWRWDSDAFGTTSANEDPDGNGTGVSVNLRFPGQYYDVETGFHYNYFRTLDPSTGRYLESDPIGLAGGLNTYGYVYQNPLAYVDPTGEFGVAKYIYKLFQPLTKQTNQEAEVAGMIADAIAGGAATGLDLEFCEEDYKYGREIGTALDGVQVVGGVQTIGLSAVVTTGIYGFGAVASSATAAATAPALIALIGGAEIGSGVNSSYERYSGSSVGSQIYDLFNRDRF